MVQLNLNPEPSGCITLKKCLEQVFYYLSKTLLFLFLYLETIKKNCVNFLKENVNQT